MFCANCGTQNVEGAKFCAKCGHLTAGLAKKSSWAPLIIGLIIGIPVLGILASIVLVSLNTARTEASAEWATISAVNFSVELPRNPTYNPPEAGQIDGYSYLAYDPEQNDKALYVVKYENYYEVMQNEGVDLINADEDTVNKFLKELVDNQIEDWQISNFSSQFFQTHNLPAIKYGGQLESDGETGTVEGVIMLDGAKAYYVVSIAEAGYVADFNRVLDSLIIK